jgi:hypothetical protein
MLSVTAAYTAEPAVKEAATAKNNELIRTIRRLRCNALFP